MVANFAKTSQVDRNFTINVAPKPEAEAETFKAKLTALISAQPMMIFIKGTPAAPECGFSRTLVTMLNELKCQYGSFNILADDSVRQGLKEFSNWPTYPQLYINGELIGFKS
jgi:Grx4 family monothiol glutaredoxin